MLYYTLLWTLGRTDPAMPTIATNKKALADFTILEKIEAGIVLTGPEVKSVRAGQINLKGSYATVDSSGTAWLIGAHIAPYKPAHGHQQGYDPTQSRKLLLNRREIDYLIGKQRERGLTIIAISVYTKGGLIKIGLAVAQGKRQFDKRETLKRRTLDREIKQRLRR